MTEVTLKIPERWKDITIGTYQEYVVLQTSKKKDKTKVIEGLALLCNTTTAIVKKIAYSDLLDIMQIVKILIDTEPDKTEFSKRFMFNGSEYGFVPNLSKITTGEYIDLESYCKEPIENLHIILSILYRPVTFTRGDRYTIEAYDPEQFKEQVFKDCSMDIALNTLGFFLTLGSVLAKTTLNYLEAQKATPLKV